jgi:uncharacterized peroxidase-related enzyme
MVSRMSGLGYLRLPPFDEDKWPQLRLIRDDYGFIPNFFKVQTLRPDFIETQIRLAESILIRDGELSRAQKEYVFLVCSAANLSTYCVTAHCEIIRLLNLEGPEVETIATNHNATTLPIADKALLNFSLKLNGQPSQISSRDIEGLRVYGFGEQAILEAVLVVGLAKFANWVSFGLGTVPDFEKVSFLRT